MDWMKRRTPSPGFGLQGLLWTALSLTGCTENEDTFLVDAVWDINTAAATRDRCREQEIVEVRLRVEREDGDGESLVDRFPCEAGHAVMRIPRESAGLGLIADNAVYTFTFDALDRDGKVLQGTQGEFETFGEPVYELPTVDIFQPLGDAARLTAEWGFSDGQSCAQRGVAHVALDISARSDPDFLDAVELVYAPCEDEVLLDDDRLLLATGKYWVRYVSLDASDAALEVGDALKVSVPRPGPDIDLPTWIFE